MIAKQNSTGLSDHWMLTETERNFQFEPWYHMLQNYHIPIITVALYIISLFLLQKWMQNRQPLVLKTPLIVWNILLSVFSIIGSFRIVPEAYLRWKLNGWHKVCCVYPDMNGVVGFWATAFALSKFAELIDSYFIVLRKKKLIFLHWFHHASVLVFTWIALSGEFSVGTIPMPVNYFVHSFMYTYYALMAMGYRLPRNLAMCITTAQIIQMFVAVYANVYVVNEKMRGRRCETSNLSLAFSLSLFVFYAFLFLNFFIQTYARNLFSFVSNKKQDSRDRNNNITNGVASKSKSL